MRSVFLVFAHTTTPIPETSDTFCQPAQFKLLPLLKSHVSKLQRHGDLCASPNLQSHWVRRLSSAAGVLRRVGFHFPANERANPNASSELERMDQPTGVAPDANVQRSRPRFATSVSSPECQLFDQRDVDHHGPTQCDCCRSRSSTGSVVPS